MAIPIACRTLIVRADVLDAHYPGRADAYRQQHPCKVDDGQLIGLFFMSSDEVCEQIGHLLENGVPEYGFAVIDRMIGLMTPQRDWLDWGEREGRQAAWLKDGFTPERKDAASKAEEPPTQPAVPRATRLTRLSDLPEGNPFKNGWVTFVPPMKH